MPDGEAALGSARPGSRRRARWLVWGLALLVGIAAGLAIGILRTGGGTTPAIPATPVSARPAAVWAAGSKPAPDFRLTDQHGQPVSLARFRGRPVIVTFIDPLCRNFCPTEAKILEAARARLRASQRPAIVAVSVNQWGNARRILLQDVRTWKLSRDWFWAVGPAPALRKVWKAYAIGVRDDPRTVAGVTVHEITHTEAAYVVDRRGDQRALYLYPFRAADVARTVRRLAGAQG